MAPKRAVPDDGSGDTDVKKAKSEGGEKKLRGRPPLPDHLKKKNTDSVPKARGRGRPKKVKKTVGSKRGRPKKAPVSGSEEESKEEDEEEQEEEGDEEQEEAPAEKPKKVAAAKAGAKKRGRPKKQTADEEDES